jgi:hypothetical protein
MYTVKYQGELNREAAAAWFQKYAELFSCFQVEGPVGLRARMAAFFNTENFGTDELNKLAETSLNEKQWLARLQVDPDAPYDDGIYMALFQKISSQAFVQLIERGVIEEIKLVEEFPAIAQQQYDALVREAQSLRPVSVAELKASQNAELKSFADKYAVERADNLRPKGGVIVLAGQTIPWVEFQNKFNAAVAAGFIK